ncbi:MAG: hypothetical protein FWF37_00235 [Chloroflexi bacterium]|nr:hypothetical protein [Chloroflexota bacterium]
MKDLDAYKLAPNEYKVADLLKNMGSPKANWQQNSSVMRSIMKEGNPIKDVTPFNRILDPKLGITSGPGGTANTFLHMERNLLYEHGWRYCNGYWSLI